MIAALIQTTVCLACVYGIMIKCKREAHELSEAQQRATLALRVLFRLPHSLKHEPVHFQQSESGRKPETAFVYDGEIILIFMRGTNKPFFFGSLTFSGAKKSPTKDLYRRSRRL